MSTNNFFNPESLLEQGVSIVKKTGDVAAKQVKATVQTAASQVTGNASVADTSVVDNAAAAAQTQEFVQELYGIKKPQQQQANSQHVAPHVQSNTTQTVQPQDASGQAKLAETRQQLAQLKQQQHMREYYDPTFNRPKQEEEKPVEKLEREKQEEDFALQKKKIEKPPDLAVEQSRAEKHPGASG